MGSRQGSARLVTIIGTGASYMWIKVNNSHTNLLVGTRVFGVVTSVI